MFCISAVKGAKVVCERQRRGSKDFLNIDTVCTRAFAQVVTASV